MTNDIELIAWVSVKIPVGLSFDSDEPLPSRIDLRTIALENFLDHPAIKSDDIPTLEGYVDSINIESLICRDTAAAEVLDRLGNLMDRT